MTTRRAGVLAVLLAAAAALAACSGPSQAGSAAIVGDTAIPVDTVQARVDGVLNREPAARAAQRNRKLNLVSRQVLTLSVRHELVSRLARHERLRVDRAAVDALIAASGGAGEAARGTVLDAGGVVRQVTDTVLLAEFAHRMLPGLAVTFDYALVSDPAKAERLARRIASDPARAAAVIRGAVRAGGAGGLGKRVVAGREPRAAASPLFAIPAHTVAVYPVGGSSARWLVVLVRAREPGGAGRAAPGDSPVRTRLLGEIGLRLLACRNAGTDIRVSPRYGAWDPLAMRVVASHEVATGLEIPVGGGG